MGEHESLRESLRSGVLRLFFGTYSYPVPQWLIIDTEYQMSQLLDETQSFVDLNYGMPADKGRAGI